jgi:16S rRNA (guanine527-N7)-methyltransferase
MDKLTEEFRAISGVTLNPQQQAALKRYGDELTLWNTQHNLTAIRDPENVRVKHFLDSLSAYLAMRGTAMGKVVDVGTGAGFPGLPLKILCPNIKLTLVESVGKKAAFCRHIIDVLKLEDVEVIHTRAETLGQDSRQREQYDWALARAVAVMPVLLEYLLPLVRIGGFALAMKGESAPVESHAAEKAAQILGGHLRHLIPVTLPGVAEERYLVVMNKIAATPNKYPRRAGIPAKRPL